MSEIQLLHGDCLELLKNIPDGSIDAVISDFPYGLTECEWDSIIPLEPMWKQLERIIKSNGAVVLTSCQPFTTTLINSNMRWFRYDLVWTKSQGTGFYNANRMPLRAHEDILVFYNKLPTYNPQKTEGAPYTQKRGSASDIYKGKDLGVTINKTGQRYPLSWRIFKRDKERVHPTQKPVALMEYLINTYTNPDDTVVDPCIGSGTTGVACVNTCRSFIGMEIDKEYFNIAKKRIAEAQMQVRLI